MTDTSAPTTDIDEERPPPEVGVRVIYQGPVAPHWEVEGTYGDATLVAEFRRRTMARLQLLPPHDPQFGRNRARVSRDAERENFELAWDIGEPEDSEAEDHEASQQTAAEADEAS